MQRVYRTRLVVALLAATICCGFLIWGVDMAIADGGQQGGGRSGTAATTTGSGVADDQYSGFPAPTRGQLDNGLWCDRGESSSQDRVCIQWFHPQKGDLIFAQEYDAKTGNPVFPKPYNDSIGGDDG